jgi:hypothetical protein
MDAPKIDRRTYPQLVEQTETLAALYTDLEDKEFRKYRNDGRNDAGAALIRIFARMLELVIERLNQVPEKNFLAFLDLIGTRLSPPRAARVPLTFELAAGSSNDAPVPARTMVSAPPPEGEDEEVVFETERELVVSASKPVAVFMRDPANDSWADLSPILEGTNQKPVFVFEGNGPINHRLYMAQSEIITLPQPKVLILTIKFAEAVQRSKLPLFWCLWDGNAWQSLTPEISAESGTQWKVTFKDPPIPAPYMVNNIEAAWICVAPAKPLPSIGRVPVVKRIAASYQAEKRDLLPDLGFANTAALDYSKDFFPFGEQPRFNDTFYIASQDAFSKVNAPITIKVALTNSTDPAGTPPPAESSANLRLIWEFWNVPLGKWEFLGESGPGARQPSPHKLKDDTRAFTKPGSITFVCPPICGPVEVNGQLNSWIRVRIVDGNYGKEAYTVPKTIEVGGTLGIGKSEITVHELQPARFRPPSIQSLTIDYTHTSQPQEMDVILSENNFVFENHSHSSSAGLEGFKPFTPAAEASPAIYLGFGRPFSNKPVTLYADVEENRQDPLSEDNDSMPMRLIWEYAGSSTVGWTRLWVQDETHGFTESGLISFIGPKDIARRREFGQNHYWLRIRREDAKTPFSPRLRRMLVNTIWAAQVQSFADEILGSSNGEPDQVFYTIQTPVLPGPCIEVRESEMLSSEEKAKIESAEGRDAITVMRDAAGRSEGIWVRWHEVPNFFGSDSRDRHYVINHLTGELQFGDGIHGMIPLQDRNNIRASHYRTGGGKRGNLPAGTIAQLKTTVPYIDSVTNWVAASGGTETEDTTSLKRRGPRTIRHRNRAVTYQDFKDLGFAASSDVARVYTVFPRHATLSYHQAGGKHRGSAGRMDLIVVPHSLNPRPEPSQGLKRRVQNYILDRCEPGVDVRVSAANWIEVTLTAEIVPVLMATAGTLGDVIQNALQHFLHPLTGGFDKRGWAFGRVPHKSEFYRLIESIEGVDHVSYLKVYPESEVELLPLDRLERSLVVSGNHVITIKGL